MAVNDLKPKAFSDEEIANHKITVREASSIDLLPQLREAEQQIRAEWIEEISRFLNTIAARDKRIEELEGNDKKNRVSIAELIAEKMEQAATIERLRGETVPKELILKYLSQRIRYYDENKFPEWSRALNDAIVKAYTWLKMLIKENKLEGATNDEARHIDTKEKK